MTDGTKPDIEFVQEGFTNEALVLTALVALVVGIALAYAVAMIATHNDGVTEATPDE